MLWPLILFSIISSVFGNDFLSPGGAIDSNKINVCFATINSENERKVFTEHLSQGSNKGKFNFIELVSGSDKWFQQACESKVRCDLLLISGEFAGRFFGDKGSLPIEEMEARSCSNECSGVLHSPKEVFLLGCNTLAGKEEDSRTAEQYLSVLLEHGTPMSEAVLRTEERYGAVNSTNRHRFQKIFRGVPHIYGFNSIGPSGKTVEPLLKNYLKKIPDYSKYMTGLEAKKAVLLSGKLFEGKNDFIEASLSPSAITQCHGFPDAREQDPGLQLKCLLHDPKRSNIEKLSMIRDILKKGDIGASLDDIHFFLSGITPYYLTVDEKKLFESIQNDPEISKRFVDSMSAIKMPLLKLKYADLAVQYKWLDDKKGKEAYRSIVGSHLSAPITTEKVNFICGANFKNVIDHSYVGTKLKNQNLLEGKDGWRIADCLNVKHPYVQEKALKFLTSSEYKDYQRGVKALVEISKVDRAYHSKVIEHIHSSELIKELEKQSPLSSDLIEVITSNEKVLTDPNYSKLLSENKLSEKSRLKVLELSSDSDTNKSITAYANFENTLKRRDVLTEAESDIYIKKILYKWSSRKHESIHILPVNNKWVVRSMMEDLKDDSKDIDSSQQSLYLSYLTQSDVSQNEVKEAFLYLKKNRNSLAPTKSLMLKQVIMNKLDKLPEDDQKEILKSKVFK